MRYKKATYINIYKNEEKYFLQSDFKENKEFIINESMYNFINFFVEYITFEDVYNKYKLFIQENQEKLKDILLNFFNDLINEKVLINEKEQEPLVKQKFSKKIEDKISDFKIIETIASSNNLEIYKVCYNDSVFVAKGYFKDKFTFNKNFDLFSNNLKYEAKILNILFDIEYVNRIFEIIENEEHIFIFLEFIEGSNLYEYLNHNKLNKIQKNNLIKIIVKTFSLIHNKGIIHGDIHFGNIMINNGNPHVIDFGLSNLKCDNKFKNGGFPLFMPPERISSDFLNKFSSPSSLKSDVYQIGILIYFILTLEMPFISTNWKDLVIEKKNFNLIFSEKIDLYYTIIKKCISTNLSDRYDNASEIYNEIIKL
jgi:serine/threonine protein kinase